MKHVGREIDMILTNKGIKKKDFAKKIKMSAVNLSKILHKKSIDAELLEKIASALNVPVNFFFTEGSNNNMDISGQVQVGNSNSQNMNNSDDCDGIKKDIEILKEKIKGLTNENELLKEMNEMLKNK